MLVISRSRAVGGGDRHDVGVSRRLLVWLLTLPLAIAGTQLAHVFAYRLVTPEAHERAHELSATGHGYLAYLPLGLAIATVLIVLALAVEIRHIVAAPDRSRLRPHAWSFAALAPAIFAFQEYFERLVHDGVFPWEAVLAPSFLVGLLLQLPFAVLAWLLALLICGSARAVGTRLRRRRLGRVSVRGDAPRLRPLSVCWRRLSPLAGCAAGRAPPGVLVLLLR